MEPTVKFIQTVIAAKLTKPLSSNQASEVYEAGAHRSPSRCLSNNDGTRWFAKPENRQINLALADAMGTHISELFEPL
ncbi:hypothetical protein [Ruegeria sp. SCP11]|uniref:hypothetical protein n=1 Tax=Ruegeria sp. SCP11 TaxID=3141378 RepID=UPI00333C8259